MEATSTEVTLDVEAARQLALSALRRLEFTEDEATRIAAHLLDAQMRGDFTGLARILLLAQTTPTAAGSYPPAVIRDSPTTALLDGGGRFGFVAAEEATALAVEKAKAAGVGVVGVNNHSFTASLSYYLRPALAEGFVVIATSTLFAAPGNTRVAPYGAGEALVGTNPLAIGVPTEDEPIIWDASTASISGGRLMYHIESGLELDDGIGLDADGRPTRDPVAAWGGSVRAWGGHRGSGLAIMLQLLGLLCDAELGSGDMTFLVMAIDPSRFGPAADFKRRAGAFAATTRAARPEVGFDKVRLPFDRSRERYAKSQADGVTLPRRIYDQLAAIGRGEPVPASGAGTRADGRNSK